MIILNIEKEKEKIALGLKQKTANPWDEVEKKFPVDSRVRGEVVNIMNYGAFVKLEPGVEGLVHISEMSWTRRITHPSEVVSPGQEIEVVVLGINKAKQEVSLGIKQTEVNPWYAEPDAKPSSASKMAPTTPVAPLIATDQPRWSGAEPSSARSLAVWRPVIVSNR